VIERDNTVSWRKLKLQLPGSPLRHHWVKARVRVHQYPDGQLALFHGPACIARYDALGHPEGAVPTTGRARACSAPTKRPPPSDCSSQPRRSDPMPRPTVHRFRSGPVVTHQKRTNDVLQKPDNLKSCRKRRFSTFSRKSVIHPASHGWRDARSPPSAPRQKPIGLGEDGILNAWAPGQAPSRDRVRRARVAPARESA
jgi:hypothetical protein